MYDGENRENYEHCDNSNTGVQYDNCTAVLFMQPLA